jgi:hypothetical protein
MIWSPFPTIFFFSFPFERFPFPTSDPTYRFRHALYLTQFCVEPPWPDPYYLPHSY